MGEQTNRAEVARGLRKALSLQHRCALAFAVAAGTLPGPDGVSLSRMLRRWAADELVDVERVAGRIVALGGDPSADTPPVKLPPTWKGAVRRLSDYQGEAMDAFVAAIPADADDAEGEATEHLLEHIVNRKRDVLELLERALR